ncbi:MAG: Gfo/Idh/MocA family protein [Chloroflexota bacterium]
MSKKLGVCIVGCGYMGNIHAQGWQAVSDAQVVAVVDILPERAERLSRLLGCPAYQAYTEALNRPDVNVVSVCVPTCLHPAVTVSAARRGLHVLCEKPVALTLADADAMIASARENNVKLGLGFMRRHTPVLESLKTHLAAGDFGRPVMYHAGDVREIRPKREMHDPNANGGPLIDMAVHLIDTWNTAFDSAPVAVSAQGIRLAAGRPEISHIPEAAIDTATLLVRYASGDLGAFVVSWGLPPKVNPPDQPDQIYAPRGQAMLQFGQNRQELIWMREGGSRETLSISHQDMYQQEIARFTRWVLADEPFPATGEDGKRALRVALAALESIQTGATISLE